MKYHRVKLEKLVFFDGEGPSIRNGRGFEFLSHFLSEFMWVLRAYFFILCFVSCEPLTFDEMLMLRCNYAVAFV